jgi:hypothetical protein
MGAFLNHASRISPRSIARILADFRWVDLQVIRPPADAARIGQPTLVNVPGSGAVDDQNDR